jgi:hypothetical protein
MTDALAREITKAGSLARAMISEYVGWRDKIAYNKETTHGMYMETLDFVNFRVETADSCLLLIENRRIADALGLCRALLENHLLFMLMCRGTKFFRWRDLSNLTEGDFKKVLAAEQADLQQAQTDGKTTCLAVERYPRAKRHLMYVFEGLNSPDADVPSFRIPAHYFHFREFHPETMRLKDENYFQYYEPTPEAKKADKKHRMDQETRYRFYLSYDSLLTCLELNGLANDALQDRIEAHYTFLGKFLHPTHNAARDLHEHANVHNGWTQIGMDQQYTQTAVLLACLYVCYLLAAILDEAASLFEQAPAEYMTDPGTTALRSATARVSAEFPYFWFLFNDPPLYDRFAYCSTHASTEELAEWGGYANVPFDRVPFSRYIYDHLKHALGGWSNSRCGVYRSPLA